MSKAALFLHGFLTDDKDFGRLYDFVNSYYDEMYKYVFPGHTKPNDFSLYNAEDSIAEPLKIFDELQSKYDEVDVYGFSMGGAVSTNIAKQRTPHKMVLFAPANKYLNFTFIFKEFKYQLSLAREYFDEDDARSEAAKKALENLSYNDKLGLSMFLDQLLPNYTFHNLSTFTKIIRNCNEGLNKIDVPTLICWGKLDQFVPYESVEYLFNMMTSDKSKVKVFEDLSHLMLYSKNDLEVINEVVSFIKEDE